MVIRMQTGTEDSRIARLALTASLMLACAGCSEARWNELKSSGHQPAVVPEDPNIIGVRKIISQEPWLSFSPDGLREVDGLKMTLYLESGTTGKGAFGDGTIRITLYSVEQTGESSERLKREYRWELTPLQSLPWRAKDSNRLGWGYGLRLPWKGVDVSGKEVEIVAQFERRDGQMLSAEPIRLRVPARKSKIVTQVDSVAAKESRGKPLPAEKYSPARPQVTYGP